LKGACYTVRGRLGLANGTPGTRIWIVGTKRLLGVLDSTGSDGEYVPPQVYRLMAADPRHIEVFGDYTVCPFTEERPGWMRMVCVADSTNLVALAQ